MMIWIAVHEVDLDDVDWMPVNYVPYKYMAVGPFDASPRGLTVRIQSPHHIRSVV